MKTINKGDTVYYTRVFPGTGTYDLCDLVVRTVMDNWFCGVDYSDSSLIARSAQGIKCNLSKNLG